MAPDQYTADAICRAMGLDGFVELGSTLPTLRLLLKPSFHPEVCLTLIGPADAARVSVVVLTEMLWPQPFPRRLPELREQVTVPAAAIDEACAEFAAVLTDRDPSDRVVCLEGMGIECCLVSGCQAEQFASHTSDPAVSVFVSRLLRLAWEARGEPRVRNALAACAGYVGAEYPTDSEPPVPLVSQLLILGTPGARADLLDLLRRRRGAA